MAYEDSEPGAALIPATAKLVIAGGFGAGKTTLIGSVSEIRPLRTEEVLTTASVDTDDLTGIRDKTTTTVVADFGRITFPYGQHGLVLFLFGTPGQHRFWPQWPELTRGAAGAVVLADTRRLDDCFEAISFFERRGLPFLVAVNVFDDAHRYSQDELRAALALSSAVPLAFCDARQRHSVVRVLIRLVEHAHHVYASRRGLTSLSSFGDPR